MELQLNMQETITDLSVFKQGERFKREVVIDEVIYKAESIRQEVHNNGRAIGVSYSVNYHSNRVYTEVYRGIIIKYKVSYYQRWSEQKQTCFVKEVYPVEALQLGSAWKEGMKQFGSLENFIDVMYTELDLLISKYEGLEVMDIFTNSELGKRRVQHNRPVLKDDLEDEYSSYLLSKFDSKENKRKCLYAFYKLGVSPVFLLSDTYELR